jgi:ribosomal-protein-serine acetyltransferase
MIFSFKIDKEISLVKPTTILAQQHFELLDLNRDFFGEWFEWIHTVKSVEDSKVFVKESLEKESLLSTFCFHIMYNEKLVGQINLFGLSAKHFNGEIGYWLDKDHNGKGIMTKCVRAILNFGFNDLNLNRIEICCATENEKSKAIPQKLGFRLEGTLRQNNFLSGKFSDTEVYSILKSEFNAQ